MPLHHYQDAGADSSAPQSARIIPLNHSDQKPTVLYLTHLNNVLAMLKEDATLGAKERWLYVCLADAWNAKFRPEKLEINRAELMREAAIGNKNTYAAALQALVDGGYIDYKPAEYNGAKSVVSIVVFSDEKHQRNRGTSTKSGTATGTKSGTGLDESGTKSGTASKDTSTKNGTATSTTFGTAPEKTSTKSGTLYTESIVNTTESNNREGFTNVNPIPGGEEKKLSAAKPTIPAAPPAGGQKEKSCAKKEKGTSLASEQAEEAAAILRHLNETAGRTFKPIAANLSFITARLKEKYSPEDLRCIVELKTFQWKDSVKMSKFLRPETLFNQTKCAGYHEEVQQAKANPNYAAQYQSSANNRHQPATGGNINLDSAFDKIDRMYGNAVPKGS